MKTNNKRLFLLSALIAGLNLIPAGRVTAQTFTVLHGFTPTVVIDNGNFTFGFTNSDGVRPNGGLITNSSGTILYGTASQGGNSYNGTVFAVNTDGTGFTNLHNFTALTSNTNSDGAGPYAGLVLSGNMLYGTAAGGGSSGAGTVFALNTDGTGFTNLHSFAVVDYGSNPYTNSDGAGPGGLILSGNTLYGTAGRGGSAGAGTVFRLNADGTGFTNLYIFSPLNYDSASPTAEDTNSDGAWPNAGLILSGNTLYGTASRGGSAGNGTVFALNTDGTGFTNLHSFAAGVLIDFGQTFVNSEGVRPKAGLILLGNTLYGTAFTGGSSGSGTLFALDTDGTAFTNLYTFTPLNYDSASPFGARTNREGAMPNAGLLLSGNTLYGTASGGGSGGNGTLFSLSFRPQLAIAPSGTNVILSWPISFAGFNYTGYQLQDTTDLGSPAGWSVPDPFPPIIVNGQYRVTRPMLGPQRSYRLVQ